MEFKEKQKRADLISSLGVYELRGLARELGIKSPTTKVREKLIDEISTVLSTGRIIEPKNTNKGRPFKKLANLDDILAFVSTPLPQSVAFNQQRQGLVLTQDHCGVFHSQNEPHFFDLMTHMDVLLTKELVKKHNLVEGDLVCAQLSEDGNAKKLLQVNGVNAEEYFPKQDQNLTRVLPNKYLSLPNAKVLMGGRNVRRSENQLFMDEPLKKLLEKFFVSGEENVFIGCDMSYEDMTCLPKLNATNFVTDYLCAPEVFAKLIVDAIQYITRLTNQGKQTNVFVSDVAKILHVLEQTQGTEATNIVKKLVSLAGSYAENDVTLLIGVNQLDESDELIKQNIIKISHIVA